MNTSNSNIDQLIELFPNQLLYDINLNVNPLGNISEEMILCIKTHLRNQLKYRVPFVFSVQITLHYKIQ